MKLLAKLGSTNSKLDKEGMLKGISELEFKTFAQAYDPYYVYHMKFKDYRAYELGEPCEAMFDLLGKILSKRYTGNAAKAHVETFAAVHGDLIKLVINKDLRCGVTATTFNKVYPGAIPQFKVQLAKAVDLKEVSYPVLLQIKYDGVRMIIINKEQEVKFFTRNGKEVLLPYIKSLLEAAPFKNYMMDSEVTLANGTQDERTKVSGMINSAMHGGMINETDLVFNCFDFMTLSQWEAALCGDTYASRFTILRDFLKQVDSGHFELAHTNEVHNQAAVDELYDKVLEMGYEGLILKHESHMYTFKRSKDWVKLKEIKTADLRCTGIQEGTGKYEGAIGALICEGEVEGQWVNVNVGSGLSDLQRNLDDIQYISEIVEIKYNAVIKDSITGKYSLFLPRFVCVRYDK